MRVAGTFSVLLLSLPLAGCFSLTNLAGTAPLPEWAMSPQSEFSEESRLPRRTAAPQKSTQTANRRVQPTGRVTVGVPTLVRPAGLPKGGETARHAEAGHGSDVVAFSPAWQAREDAADEKLRRSMRICGGC